MSFEKARNFSAYGEVMVESLVLIKMLSTLCRHIRVILCENLTYFTLNMTYLVVFLFAARRAFYAFQHKLVIVQQQDLLLLFVICINKGSGESYPKRIMVYSYAYCMLAVRAMDCILTEMASCCLLLQTFEMQTCLPATGVSRLR